MPPVDPRRPSRSRVPGGETRRSRRRWTWRGVWAGQPSKAWQVAGSERRCCSECGIGARLLANPAQDVIAKDIALGNPVILDTPAHYFVADAFDPTTGRFHVGNSGTAFKAGSAWLSLNEMQRLAGPVRAAVGELATGPAPVSWAGASILSPSWRAQAEPRRHAA